MNKRVHLPSPCEQEADERKNDITASSSLREAITETPRLAAWLSFHSKGPCLCFILKIPHPLPPASTSLKESEAAQLGFLVAAEVLGSEQGRPDGVAQYLLYVSSVG